MIRVLCTLLLSFAVCANAARAASDVSARYDGFYDGVAQPVAWMSRPGCAAFEVRGLQISKGFVTYRGDNEAPRIRGFITEEGYFKSTVVPLGSAATPLEGRLVDGRIIAGVIDEMSGCTWTLELVPAVAP